MHELIAWSGFAGGWLLVAGPLYQAAIELREEAFGQDDMERTQAAVGSPPQISPWWWLVPPVYYLKHRRRSADYREAVLAKMSPEGRERMVSFLNKAHGWFYVAAGAFFIALKETWELHELHEWPTVVFWAVSVVMLLVCVGNTALSIRRSDGVIAGDADAPSGVTTAG